MKTISCVWGAAAEADAQRIRRFCTEQGWELVAEAIKGSVSDGTLGWMLHVAPCAEAERVVLTREGIADLEAQLPRIWGDVRGWLEDQGVSVIAL